LSTKVTKQWVCEVARFKSVIEIYYRPTLVTTVTKIWEFNTKLAINRHAQVKLVKFKFKFKRFSKST